MASRDYRIALVALGLASVTLAPVAALGEDDRVTASVAVTSSDETVTIIGKATASEAGSYRGQMIISKIGQSGRANTTQGGSLELAAGETADIARVGLSMQPGDRIEVSVNVLDGETVLATAVTELSF